MKKMPKNKEKIYHALKDLHFEYDPYIVNDWYRGPKKISPMFTVNQVSEYVKVSSQTARKWLNQLVEEKKVCKRSKKRYYANDPVTYLYARNDLPLVELHEPLQINWEEKIFCVFTKLSEKKDHFFRIKTRWINARHIPALQDEITTREKNTGDKYKVFLLPEYSDQKIFN